MDKEHVLRGRSILIRDGKIAAIARRIPAPADARVIDGRGTAYVMPGLADMHVHVRDREMLSMLLASGVTTALDMGEASNAIVGRTRSAIARGDIPGPTLFAALAVDGSSRYAHLVVPTPAAANWAVQLAKANGYDFIKVYNGLSPGTFASLAREGQAAGLPLVGHHVESLGIERQIGLGQVMIAHLEEFLYGFFRLAEGADPLSAPSDAEITRAVNFLRATGATVTADLATYQAIASQWGRPDRVQADLQSSGVRYLSPTDRIAWRRSDYQRRSGSLDDRAAFLARFTRALAAAGVPLIAGTDAPTVPGLAAGDALHRELVALEAAGLSRFQVLVTATKEPGMFIGRVHPEAQPFGTLVVGSRADLLLLEGNPLENLSVLRKPLGVMASGRWKDEQALAEIRRSVAETYSSATH